MPAPEPVAQPRRHPAFSSVSVPESGCASGSGSTGGAPAPAVSMRDLLAACAAADAVSRPPRAPEPHDRPAARGHREAA
ncbi:hypothetical protein [Streptomyces galbus]|uniref:Uncharacterized protein n=1 Tax=Streptomyces galbus TaxID=33898 RepID=A0A4U5WVA8_STRGB|nr:hypothetical protein [Streptomyces galbus]TKT06437.1 hypothetical protein E4U92_27395 [Streptomyces galbus]GHD48294.1 hypothetical protein GCM10010335_56850 [Streptomyces galbus]